MYMLTLAHRFHGHNSLRPVYQIGASLYGRNLKLLCASAEKSQFRVAVVVSKKVHKSAVVRNRIRRRVYEIVRLYANSEPLQKDLIFLAQNASIAALPAEQLRTEVTDLLKKSTN